MSIDRVNISNLGMDRSQLTQGTDQVRSAEKDQHHKGSSGSDSLSLSSKAKDIEWIANSLDQSRSERLNKVREALDAGTYNVKAEDIARKLIEANRK